jgi:hypothetical protein
MIKSVNLLVVFLVFNLFVFSQKLPKMEWAGALSSASNDSISFLQLDQEGNVYISGNFENELDLNVDTLKYNVKKSQGLQDIYITKTNVFGNQAWAKTFGGAGIDSIVGLSVINEKVFVLGYFEKEVDFGVKKITSTGNFAYFIATLDLRGNVLDVKTIQSENNKIYTFGKVVNDILYFTGTTTSSAVFLERRNLEGELVWFKQIGGDETIQLVTMSNDEQSDIYVAGNFLGVNIDFDPAATEVKLSSSLEYQDGFLMKLNSNGDFKWVKQIDGIKNDFITALAVRGEDVVLSGRFEERIKFGVTSMLSKGSADFFVAQYNLNGDLSWARQFGGNKQSDDAKSIVIDRYRNVYITGIFIGEGFEIGNGTVADKSVLNVNGKTSRDAFLIRIDSLGTTKYTTRFGGSGKDFGAALAIDTNDNVVVCGLYESGYGFDNPKLDGNGLRDVFVIKNLVTPYKTFITKFDNETPEKEDDYWLEIMVNDIGEYPWAVENYIETNVKGTLGDTNTKYIVLKQGQADYAANICDIFSGNGKKDWFLPSEKEMKKVFSAKDSIGGFKLNKNYWTSNESDLTTAVSKSFIDGNVKSINKFDSLPVRLVRRQIDQPASYNALILPGLKLYPNPLKSTLIIEWQANNENVRVEIINMEGKIVCSELVIGHSESKFDLSQYPNGVYNVSIQTSKGSIHKRVVKLD